MGSMFLWSALRNLSHRWDRVRGKIGYPNQSQKHLTCKLIRQLATESNCEKWLLFGDLNMVLNNTEETPCGLPHSQRFSKHSILAIFMTLAIVVRYSHGLISGKRSTIFMLISKSKEVQVKERGSSERTKKKSE
ncbi:hypothetical protein QL285_038911 [Trifolium repens]|nr:hypothetical protein QL285_038911 [Trifolium repens]